MSALDTNKTGIRVAVVFHKDPYAPANSIDIIRLRAITSGLLRNGFNAKILGKTPRSGLLEGAIPVGPIEEMEDPDSFDIVKTSYHFSIKLIGDFKGPVVSRIVRVVDEKWPERDEAFRSELLECQELIRDRSSVVAMNNIINAQRWRELYGDRPEIVLVPTGCPDTIPPLGPNPYEQGSKNLIFLGSLSSDRMVETLNQLAIRLGDEARVHLVGSNKARMYGCRTDCYLVRGVVDHGQIEQDKVWDYLRHADMGVAIATNEHPFDNDVSKVLNYLRAGLPTLSEEPILNNELILKTGLGSIFRFNDMDHMEDRAKHLLNIKDTPQRSSVMKYMATHHSWAQRVQTYVDLFPSLISE
jgi:hypothetical protein